MGFILMSLNGLMPPIDVSWHLSGDEKNADQDGSKYLQHHLLVALRLSQCNRRWFLFLILFTCISFLTIPLPKNQNRHVMLVCSLIHGFQTMQNIFKIHHAATNSNLLFIFYSTPSSVQNCPILLDESL